MDFLSVTHHRRTAGGTAGAHLSRIAEQADLRDPGNSRERGHPGGLTALQ